MSSSVKRACDACHCRKVKCDGINPCRNCSSAQLSCTYKAIPQKKGPKGSRAKVISELRETQRQSTLSSKVANRLNGITSPPCRPTLTPTPGLLTNEMVKDCIEFFFTSMYPTLPILHRGRLEQQAMYADQNIDTREPDIGNLLMEETLRVRKSYDHLETPTLNNLATSFFLFGCFFGLDLHNKAWFHLREATTLAHILGLRKEDTYLQFDAIDSSRRSRLYWLLFVTERAYALQRHRPLSLQATITLPTQQDDPSYTQAVHLNGFIHLVNLFRPFDEGFLRTMVWQLSIQNRCLSSGSDDPIMTFQYPVDISRDLIPMTSQFSHQSMEVHGIGLIEKLFDVACSLTDVLSLLPPNPDPFQLGPRDYLHDVMTLLSVLRNGDNRFLLLLLAKVNDVLPRLVNPMLQTVPNTLACAEVDVFDGFGTAGVGITSNFPGYNGNGTSGSSDFKMEPEQDFNRNNIATMPVYDKRIEELGSPINNREGGDNSPYASPTTMQSPMEFPGLSDYSGYTNLNSLSIGSSISSKNHLGNFGEGVGGGGRQVNYRRGFDLSTLNGRQVNGDGMSVRRPPIRQGSGSSYGMQIPRSIPEQYTGLQRAHSGRDDNNMGMSQGAGAMPYR
ncbi:hypothetical protein DL95DRAFT_426401 [Leptodontidium sp. 2 PMI_412]|nr:hypothetical protein DL95DRAFT_426401 [Leptodontidium sp. 2 PMI_412]